MDSEAKVVLVADDDEDIRGLVSYRLTAAGFRVLEASDGQAALDLAVAEVPDVAVLDVMMPRVTGVELTRALRADARTERVKVILLTSRSQEHDVAAGFGAGADDYVTKPFSPQELLARVNAVLARR